MCGRYALRRSFDELIVDLEQLLGEELGDIEADESLTAGDEACTRYNIRPSSRNLVLRYHDNCLTLGLSRWGFQPSWMTPDYQRAKKRGPFINARAETAGTQRAFAEAAQHQRCLVLADGFYESTSGDGPSRQPHFFEYPDHALFFMAGVETSFPGPGWDPQQANYAILTEEARTPADAIHHRMPVICPAGSAQDWLAQGAPILAEGSTKSCVPDPIAAITNFAVGRGLFKRNAEGPDCLAPPEPVVAEVPAQGSLF